MKAFVYAIIFVSFSAVAAFAGQNLIPYKIADSVEVGPYPVNLFTAGDEGKLLYVVCVGADVSDGEPSHPSIWRIDNSNGLHAPGAAVKIAEFNVSSVLLPCRFDYRVDGDTSYLLLPFVNNIVSEINLITGAIRRNYFIDGAPLDAKYDGEYFRVCVSDELDAPGRILRYRLSTGAKVDELSAGVNLQEAIVLGGGVIGTLSIGKWGTDDSDLWLRKISDNNEVTDSVSIHLGNTGYSLFNDKGKYLYATVNGSHKVLKIDLTDPFHNLKIDTLPTATTGWDGPRETFVVDSTVYTSTYAGKLNIYKEGSNSITDVVEFSGKIEGLYGVSSQFGATGYLNKLFVASPCDAEFKPNNKIFLVEGGVSSVYESLATAPFTIYPNPANEILNVKFENPIPDAKIEIRDLSGRLVKSAEIFDTVNSIELNGLPQGSYFAVITIEKKKWSAPFTVIK